MQQDGRTATEKRRIITDFLARSVQITSGYKLMKIYNMDETTCYFDMASDQTLHFRSEKNVDGIDTGHKKSRFTVALCCSADGRMIKSLIIFKGLKKVPKLSVPTNVEVTVSMGGSMNTGLMLKWIRSCSTKRGPFFANTFSLLYMDSYGTHLKEKVFECLRTLCGTKVAVIPPKMTSMLQPLDVVLNIPFKAALRQAWMDWLINGLQEMTSKGYCRRPSYQSLVDMVSQSVRSLSQESIKKSFRVCGIAAEGEEVPETELHGRLKQMLTESERMLPNPEGSNVEIIIDFESEEESDSDNDVMDFTADGAVEIVECGDDEESYSDEN